MPATPTNNRPVRKLYFDTETTGIPGRGNYPHIIQLGAMLTVGETETTARETALFHCLIRPESINGEPPWTVPEETTRIHGLTTEMCRTGGIELADALGIFNEFASMAGELVAHNYTFDATMLDLELKRLHWQANYYNDVRQYCTMREATPIVKAGGGKGSGFQKFCKLSEAYEFFMGTSFEGAHTAIGDVRACHAVHMALLEHLAAPAVAPIAV